MHWPTPDFACGAQPCRYLGLYNTEVEAAIAHNKEAVRCRGIDAVTNFDLADYKGLLGMLSQSCCAAAVTCGALRLLVCICCCQYAGTTYNQLVPPSTVLPHWLSPQILSCRQVQAQLELGNQSHSPDSGHLRYQGFAGCTVCIRIRLTSHTHVSVLPCYSLSQCMASSGIVLWIHAVVCLLSVAKRPCDGMQMQTASRRQRSATSSSPSYRWPTLSPVRLFMDCTTPRCFLAVFTC